jgi:hypothetical protein
MTLLEQWEARKREIEALLAEGRIDADEAGRKIRRLEYRIKRRPFILKRGRDRKTWRQAQAAKWRPP